jgi:hypothetical protein
LFFVASLLKAIFILFGQRNIFEGEIICETWWLDWAKTDGCLAWPMRFERIFEFEAVNVKIECLALFVLWF